MSNADEINIQNINEVKSPYDRLENGLITDERTETINKLVQAVKQLDKKIKEKE